jgi:hypothetical protein
VTGDSRAALSQTPKPLEAGSSKRFNRLYVPYGLEKLPFDRMFLAVSQFPFNIIEQNQGFGNIGSLCSEVEGFSYQVREEKQPCLESEVSG